MNEIIGCAVCGAVSLLLLALGIFLIKGGGRGAMMVAGFNTMPKKEREKYDTKALCRFVGWLLIAVDACMLPIMAGAYLGIRWLSACGGAATVILTIATLFYANTGGRFQKK